jgi:Spy/CpxP family protein refolding chaperone
MRTSRFFVAALAAAGLFVVASSAQAQPGGGGGFGRGFGGVQDEIDAARQRNVQQVLELEDAQVEQIRELGTELDQEMREYRAKLAEKYMKKLESDILLPHQAELLLRATIQLQGDDAVRTNATLQKKLGISGDQKKKMDEISESTTAKVRELFPPREPGGGGPGGGGPGGGGPGGGGFDQELFQKMREIREEGQKEMMAVLTDKQQSDLETLKGEPIEALQRRGFGGGGGQGGPGGGGGRRPGGEGGGRPRPDTAQ